MIQREIMTWYEKTHNIKHETEVRENAIVCKTPREFSMKFREIGRRYKRDNNDYMFHKKQDNQLFLLDYSSCSKLNQATLNRNLLNSYLQFTSFSCELVFLNGEPVVYLTVSPTYISLFVVDIIHTREVDDRAEILFDMLISLYYKYDLKLIIDRDDKIKGIESCAKRESEKERYDINQDNYEVEANILMAWIYMNRANVNIHICKNNIRISDMNSDTIFLDTTIYSSADDVRDYVESLLLYYKGEYDKPFSFVINNKNYADIIRKLLIKYDIIKSSDLYVHIQTLKRDDEIVYVLTAQRDNSNRFWVQNEVMRTKRIIFGDYNFNYNDPIFTVRVGDRYYEINRRTLGDIVNLTKLYDIKMKVIGSVKNVKRVNNEINKLKYGTGGEYTVKFEDGSTTNISRYGLEKILPKLRSGEIASFKRNYTDPANMMKK